jgi:uncharacterized membrane protein YfhO
VYADNAYEVWENTDTYSRIFLASSYIIATTDKDIIGTLFAKDFDRRNSLVLEEKPSVDPQSGTGSAHIVSYTSDKVTIETYASSPKLLFLSDEYDSGWHAFVDGKESRIYRADYDFRAVVTPAGKHTIVFTYAPEEFQWGIMFSIIGVAGLFYFSKRI